MISQQAENFERKTTFQARHKNHGQQHKQLAAKPSQALLQSSPKLYFIQWLKSLPFQERFIALRVHAPCLANLIRESLKRFEQDARITEGQYAAKKPKGRSNQKEAKSIFQILVFVTDGHNFLDSIGFDFNFLDSPEKLYDLLVQSGKEVREQKIINPFEEALKMRRDFKQIFADVSKCKSLNELSSVLIRTLRHQIFWNCHNNIQNPHSISANLEEEKRRKKEYSILWKNLSETEKRKILMLGKIDFKELELYLGDQKIHIRASELEKQVNQLLKLEKNDFCNKIFKIKSKKSLSSVVGYYQHVYKIWKTEVEKGRKKKYHNRSNGHNTFTPQNTSNTASKTVTMQSSSFVQISTNSNGSNVINKTEKAKKKNKRHKSISAESNQTNQTQYEKGLKKCQENSEDDQFYKSQEKYVHENQYEKMEKNSGSCNKREKEKIYKKIQEKEHWNNGRQREKKEELFQIQSKPSYNSIFSPKKQIETEKTSGPSFITPLELEQLAVSKHSQQLLDFSDSISEEANGYHQRRVIAFERIQYLLQYYQIPIKLFGSCASGIAIKNSDIDIAIDNCIINYFNYLPENDRIKASLQHLQTVFSQHKCVKALKLIKTASIPLIKMTIDTKIPFLDENYEAVYEILNREHNYGCLQIDITIQTRTKSSQCNHLGIISTQSINRWLSQIGVLRSIVIVLKQLFADRGLNVTYSGGLNTYSLIVMVVAFIYNEELEEQKDVGRVFRRLIKFYSYQFDEKQVGIDLERKNYQNLIFYLKKANNQKDSGSDGKSQADLQIRDPMNKGKIMTKNCYKFPQIKSLFRQIDLLCYEKVKEQLAQNLQKMNIKVSDSTQIRGNIQERSLKQLLKGFDIHAPQPPNKFKQILRNE